MAEVKNYGTWLNLFNNETYRQEEKTKELNDALARQWEMQAKALKMAQNDLANRSYYCRNNFRDDFVRR